MSYATEQADGCEKQEENDGKRVETVEQQAVSTIRPGARALQTGRKLAFRDEAFRARSSRARCSLGMNDVWW